MSDHAVRALALSAIVSLSGTALGQMHVTNTDDGPVAGPGHLPGSLRQAIYDANAAPGMNTITFDPSLNGLSITLSAGELSVTDSVEVVGPGADLLAISGASASRVFNCNGTGTKTYSFSGLTVRAGRVSGAGTRGGAAFLMPVNAQQTLELDRVVLLNNRTSSDKFGSSIYSVFAPVRLTNCSVVNSGGGKGGIYSASGDVDIVNTTFSGSTDLVASVWVRSTLADAYLEITHSTFVDGDAAAVRIGSYYGNTRAFLTYGSTIFSGNDGSVRIGDQVGLVKTDTYGYNLADDFPEGVISSADILNTDAQLGALWLVDGVYVHAPTAQSPAVDRGHPRYIGGIGNVPPTDQRGKPRVNNERIDIGAFETSVRPTPSIDFDQNGVVNISDLFAFITAFTANGG
ncbi:MAG: choice-of-anchor Q domain-containing protein [Planctomycetota bacterium]